MTHRPLGALRAVSATIAALSVAAALMIAASQDAQASPPRWSNGHGGAVGYGHGHRHREHRYRQRHHRRYDRARRHYRANRADWNRSSTSGGFLDGITSGNLIGGLLGAAAGTQFGKGRGRIVAILGGGILGAVLGGKVQNSIQRADRRQAQSTLETAPTGRTISWSNPNTGANYTVTPTRTYQVATGRFCRDYTTWIFIDGYEEKASGTACRMPDGAWRTLSR